MDRREDERAGSRLPPLDHTAVPSANDLTIGSRTRLPLFSPGLQNRLRACPNHPNITAARKNSTWRKGRATRPRGVAGAELVGLALPRLWRRSPGKATDRPAWDRTGATPAPLPQ